jgi:hypothetical protein
LKLKRTRKLLDTTYTGESEGDDTLLQRNISGERFIGINQRLEPQVASQLAKVVRARGYNARVIDSKSKKRLYIGNSRPYPKRKGRISDLAKESLNPVNASKMRSLAPSNLGVYELSTIQRDNEYARWKLNTYRRNPNLRYVALGAERQPSERPYLLALGLMPSNVALLYLAELGAPIGPGTDIFSWYQSDRRNFGEDWHKANMRQIQWHISQKYRSPSSMDDLYNSLSFEGYKIGYKISDSDLEINTDDAFDQARERERVFEVQPELRDKLLSGYLDSSAFAFEGGSTLFDLDFRKRSQRLSDWLPDVELYLNEIEIRDLLQKAKYKMQGVPQRNDVSLPPLMNDIRRNPTKSMYLADDQPNYDKITNNGLLQPEFEPSRTNWAETRQNTTPSQETVREMIASQRSKEMYNDFTYDWVNLQKQQWGGGEAGRGVEQAKLLPYAHPQLLTSIYQSTLGEKMEALDWLPEMDNQLDLLRRVNVLNVSQVEANTQEEIRNAKAIVDDAMNLVSSATMRTDQRLGEGAGEDWDGFNRSGDWVYRERGIGFSGTPMPDGDDYYSVNQRTNRMLADYR